MIRLALKGHVSNFTGSDLRIVDSRGQLIQAFKKDGHVAIDSCEEFLGYLNGKIELACVRLTAIRGLPGVKPEQFLIVRGEVARAALVLGRNQDDLLVPMLPFYRHEGNAREIIGYQQLVPATQYCYSMY